MNSPRALLLIAALVVTGCSARSRFVPPSVAVSTPVSASAPPSSRAPASQSPSSTPPIVAALSTAPSPSGPPGAQQRLDIGGTRILPGHRVVAEYGAAASAGLGVLGAGTPDQAAAAVAAHARAYAKYGEPVVGAMELIATVALGGPGPTGQYSSTPNLVTISAYLAAAKRAHELLVLDFQPGRASFIEQVQQVRAILLDPDVSVALDPEWHVGPTQRPGHGLIGSARAADINVVASYLSQLIAANRLPQKLLVVHQFALSMLPDRSAITTAPGLAVVFHADGEGSIAAKLNTYRVLAFPQRPFYAGFKVFLKQDQRVMTPAQVMALPRVPDLVTYQ